MRKSFLLILILVLSILFTSCVSTSKTEDTWALIYKAYEYVFPLVVIDTTKTLSTNTETAVVGRAPINQLIHTKKLADANFKTIVTPNVDTIYSQAWLCLDSEPIVYVMPKADRFYNVQVLDAWTNTITVLDNAGLYAFVKNDWDVEIPDGIVKVSVPTETVWLIARIVLSGKEDLQNVYEIQEKMDLLPLSAFISNEIYEKPNGVYIEENEYVPIQKVLSMGPKEFFDRANALMLKNPPSSEDSEIIKSIAKVNVGPGMEFDSSILGEDYLDKWTYMLAEMKANFSKNSDNYTVQLGLWKYFNEPIGDFGTEYTYRAMVALSGLGANTNDIAIYPKTDFDSSYEALSSDKTYVMHFESFPPVVDDGFWSVTAYGEDNFLIDNPIDRYCINDRSNFTLNDDGSLDIIISNKQPENSENWLPVSDGNFHLYMRIYKPNKEKLKTWQSPTINAI